jgi:hypothetical protein
MRFGTRNALLLAAALFIIHLQAAAAGSGQYSIQFKDQLKITKALTLTGSQSLTSLGFMCETTWKPIAGSALHVFLSHSRNLDSGRSFLSVSLNYGVLRSLRLDELNQSVTEVTIPLPPQMLKGENEIVFAAEQFPVSGSSGEIWTAIETSSFISIEYEETRPILDLHLLPSPLLDSHSYRTKQLSVLLPKNPSSETLEATALVIANYAGNIGDATSIHIVDSVDAASGPLLIVGTTEEQSLRTIAPRLSMRREDPVDVDQGLIVLTQKPGRIFTPTLLISGGSSKAVLRGVRKVIGGQFEDGSTFTTVSHDEVTVPGRPREWKGFLPPRNQFTLADMDLKELKLDASNGFSLSLPLWATPDTRFLAYGQQMTLDFRFGSDLGTDKAILDIQLNSSSLRRLAAAEFRNGSRGSVRLKIPAHLLRRQNVLNLQWHGLEPRGTDAAVWLSPVSKFDFPRDYQSILPDLGVLQYGLFPFGLRSDLSGNIIVLPDHAGKDFVGALFEFAGLLGRLVPSDRFAFAVKYSSELSREASIDSHMILFKIAGLPKGVLATLQETVDPNSDKYRLTVTSHSAQALPSAIKNAFSEGTLKQLRGDTAYVYSDRVGSFTTTKTREHYEYSYSVHLQAWLRENWIALPVIITTISCLLFVGLRLSLVQYKSRR